MKSKTSRRQHNPWITRHDSEIHGSGLFAVAPIPEGTRIIEYTGKRLDRDEAYARYRYWGHHTFLFNLDETTVIDGADGGSDASFINHSCSPNCQPVFEHGHIYIEAIKDISTGTELTFDYNISRGDAVEDDWEELFECRCGSANCRGHMLAPLPDGSKGPDRAVGEPRFPSAERCRSDIEDANAINSLDDVDAQGTALDDLIVCREPDTESHPVLDELIIYSPTTKHGFSLNPSARLVWELADGRRTLASICQEAVDCHEGNEATIRNDIVQIATQFRDLGLVHFKPVA